MIPAAAVQHEEPDDNWIMQSRPSTTSAGSKQPLKTNDIASRSIANSAAFAPNGDASPPDFPGQPPAPGHREDAAALPATEQSDQHAPSRSASPAAEEPLDPNAAAQPRLDSTAARHRAGEDESRVGRDPWSAPAQTDAVSLQNQKNGGTSRTKAPCALCTI